TPRTTTSHAFPGVAPLPRACRRASLAQPSAQMMHRRIAAPSIESRPSIVVARHPPFLEAVLDGAPTDPENRRGLARRAAHGLEGLEDREALELGHRDPRHHQPDGFLGG